MERQALIQSRRTRLLPVKTVTNRVRMELTISGQTTPTASCTTSTNGFEDKSTVHLRLTQLANRPMSSPCVILQSEFEKFIVKDASLASFNSIVGKKKRFAGAKSRVIDNVDEDMVNEALRMGIPILNVAHVPRSWLRYPDPSVVKAAQPVLYGPRAPHLACDACVERGFLCASLEPGQQACSVCYIEKLECRAHDARYDLDVPAVSVPKVQAEDISSDKLLSQAAARLAERINKSLAKQYRRAEKRIGNGKSQSPVLSHRVTYEPVKAVFDEFTRTKKERWARFAWMNGEVSYFGDPSLPHEATISELWEMIRNSVSTLLSRTPRLTPAMESLLARFQNQDDATIESDDERLNNLLVRGQSLSDALFMGALSTAVEGLDGSLLEKPRPQVTRRSSRAMTSAWRPTLRKTMVKEPDLLLLYRHQILTGSIGLAGEIAYGNEKLDLAMRESLLWKGKSNVSITIKIDARIKDKKAVDWATSKQRSSIDPLIMIFLVRDPETDAEKSKWRNSPVKLQLAIGRGSGVRVTEYMKAYLRMEAKNSPILERVVDSVDWEGSQAVDDSEWTSTLDGFEQKAADKILEVPFKSVIHQAFRRMRNAAGTANNAWTEAAKNDFVDFVDGAQLKLDLERIRGAVICACFVEFRESLSLDDRPGPACDFDLFEAMDVDDDFAIAPSSVRGESPLFGLGLGLE